jgi:hypothetical protein
MIIQDGMKTLNSKIDIFIKAISDIKTSNAFPISAILLRLDMLEGLAE